MYDGKGEKQDYWIDVNENYYDKQVLYLSSLIIFEGNYQNGKRYGLWKI